MLGFWAFIVLFPLYWLFVTVVQDVPITVDRGPFYMPFVDFQPTLDAWHDVFVDHASRHPPAVPQHGGRRAHQRASSTVLLGATSAYALVRFRYRPRLGIIGLFVRLHDAGCSSPSRWACPGSWRPSRALAVFAILAQTIGRRFKRALGNDDIAFWLISQRILPPIAVVLPLFVLYQQLGLLDTQFAIAITYVAVQPAHRGLADARLLRDPCPSSWRSRRQSTARRIYRIFRSIVLPLAVPGLVATFLIVLIFGWNEYLIANILSSANAQTMPLLIVAQNATRGPSGGPCRCSSSS